MLRTFDLQLKCKLYVNVRILYIAKGGMYYEETFVRRDDK